MSVPGQIFNEEARLQERRAADLQEYTALLGARDRASQKVVACR